MPEAVWESLLSQVEELIEKEDFSALKSILSEAHPAEIVMIFPRLSRVEQHMVFDLIDPEIASEILVEVKEPTQEMLLQKLDEQRISDLIDEMESDEAADVLGSVEPEVAEKVLETLPDEVREDVKSLLSYDEDTAGGIMSAELVAVNESLTVMEAIEEMRKMAAELEDIFIIWVIDDNEILKGYVPLKRLLLARGNTRISAIAKVPDIVATADMDQEEAAHIMRRYDLISLAVVDEQGKLVGRITYDDAMDVLSEESFEDLGYISGTGEEEPSARSVFNSSKERLPWLIAGLAGGIVAALVMSHFELQLSEIIVLAFFVPIITAMGGNVGMQSSTIVVRGLATGEISFGDTGHRILKEMGVASLNGVVLGIILALTIWFWQGLWKESLVISVSLIIVILTAAFIGVTVPLLLKKMNIDPALAMGPFVTISNDIVGVTIYLAIATYVLT